MDTLPRIGWIGPLAERSLDDARARRVAAVLPERQAPAGSRPVLGLILLLFAIVGLHELAPNGSLPAHAPVARGVRSPPVESGDQEMQRMRSLVAGVVGVGMVTTGAAAQQAVQWRAQDGGNGHWYRLVVSGPITWPAARAACEAQGGHLVTPTSAAEDAFLLSIANRTQHPEAWVTDFGGNAGGPYIGGYQPPNASPIQPWAWVNGEPWNWAGWAAGEPNGGYAPGLSITGMLGYANSNSYRGWSDAGLNDFPPYPLSVSYVIEFDADCNNDGLVDYGQILSGQLADINQNGVPDCCEQGNPCFLTIRLDAHYAFDGNTNDSSGNARHAVSFNTSFTADRFGRPNSACAFDGVSGYLIASGIPIHTDNAFSWAMWIRCDNPNVHRPILHRAAAMGDNRHSPSLWTDPGGSMSFSSYDIGMGGSAVDTPSGALPPGQWRHFVGTSSASGTRRVYIDGALVASGSSSSYGEALPLLLIGRDPIAPWYFTGALDDIRIYGRELSASEVSVLYQWPIAPCPGDVTRNGSVDGVDLAALLAAWGGGKSQFDCDIDNDGVVSGSDLAFVLASWGACP